MKQGITYVGIDAHKKSHQVAMLLPGRRRPEIWDVENEPRALRRLVTRLKRSAPGTIRCTYEAGPCGFSLQRELQGLGVECMLTAPSLIPVKPGERVKTDRRDAAKLAGLLRADLLTEVHPPTLDEEAVRDLCRCREDARHDITRARHRMAKFLLRHGIRYSQGEAWTQRYGKWLRSLSFERRAHRAVFADYLQAIEALEERLASLDAEIEAISREEPYAEPVGKLRCFRGIDTVTAMTLVTELHGFERFTNPRQLMAFLGLVPSEHSSGDKKARGSITKTGNGHVRRVLIEAAWNQRHRPAVGVRLRRRRQGQPGWVIALADKAMRRLYKRHVALTFRGKPSAKVTVAIARELTGFVWAALQPA